MSEARAAIQPRTLGRYNLVSRLGVGAHGEVWCAHDGSLGVDVALKILSPALTHSPAAWALLEHEHGIAARLDHPAILHLMPPERIAGLAVLPIELADGGTLAALRGQSYLRIVPALLELGHGLEHAHRRGVVHRDLKPRNVLFDGRGRVKLADFGVAALLPEVASQRTDGEARMRTTAQGFSPFTASPAQLGGQPASVADDIYGLGALAYELLGGQPPHFPDVERIHRQRASAPPLKTVEPAPLHLVELVMQMLATDPRERPASVRQVIEEFEAILNSTLGLEPEPTHSDAPPAPTDTLTGPRAATAPRVSSAAQAEPVASALPVAPEGPNRPGAIPQPVPTPPGLHPALTAQAPPLRGAPEPLWVREAFEPGIETMPQYRRMGAARPREPRPAVRRPGGTPHRLGYVLFGLICGVMLTVAAVGGFPGEGLSGMPLRILTQFAARVGAGHWLPEATQGPSQGGSSAAPHGVSAVPAGATAPSSGEVPPHSIGGANRPSATEVGSAVAGSPQRPAAIRRVVEAGASRPAAERSAATHRLARERRLTAGRSSRRAHVRQRRRLEARRARADFRDAGYAKAVRAGLLAFGDGRLFEAQADFQQALVYRPYGSRAAAELAQVNAALRERAKP